MKRWTLRIVLFLILGCVTTVAIAWGCAVANPAIGPTQSIGLLDTAPVDGPALVPLGIVASFGSRIERASAGRPELRWRAFEHYVMIARADLATTHGKVLLATATDDELIWLASERPDSTLQILNRARHVLRLTALCDDIEARLKHRDLLQDTNVSDAQGVREEQSIDCVRTIWSAGWPMRAMHGEVWHMLNTGEHAVRGCAILTKGLQKRAGVGALPVALDVTAFLMDTLFYGVIWFGIFFGFGSARRALRKHRGRCPKCSYDLRGELDKGCPECAWGRGSGDGCNASL